MNLSRRYTVVGRERQIQHENETAGASAHYQTDSMFDHPVELRRVNRFGFTVITKHYSQESIDYEKAQVI